MRRIYLLLLCLALSLTITPPLQAQTTPQYRLRVPTAEEYLAAVPDIMKLNTSSSGRRDEYITLAVYKELMWHYPNFTEADFDLLYATALIFRPMVLFPVTMFTDGIDLGDWNTWLVNTWLRENPTALAREGSLHFADFDLFVTYLDVNGDNLNEILLTIQQTEETSSSPFDNYLDYWVLQKTANGYRRIPTPLNWYAGSDYQGSGGRSGIVHTLRIEDVNGDGTNEWVVLQGNYNMRGYGRCGHLHILSWRNDSLIDLINGDLFYCTSNQSTIAGLDDLPNQIDYIFSNLEIQQQQSRKDSWNCQWIETTTYRWDGVYYLPLSVEQDFENSFECHLRKAEQAMQAGNTQEAIDYYEYALQLPQEAEQEITLIDANELRQYAQIRLVTAYALIDQLAEAYKLIEVLKQENPASKLIELFVQALEKANTSLSICAAAYVTLAELLSNQNVINNWNQGEYTTLYLRERLEDIIITPERWYPDPAQAGCDLDSMIDTLLRTQAFPFNESPGNKLTELGFEVTKVEQKDFNNDGIEDWVVEISWSVLPITFLSSPYFSPFYHTMRGNPEIEIALPTPTEMTKTEEVKRSINYFGCGSLGEAFCALYEQDARLALKMIDSLTDEEITLRSVTENFEQAISYRRALALEALNRPDEALSEYIAIYETAPDSAWGMLAALHLEKIE